MMASDAFAIGSATRAPVAAPLVAPITAAAIATSAHETPIEIQREPNPFWKRQPNRLHQIRDERSVQVSVRREDQKDGTMLFVLNGAGDVAKDCAFSFAVGQQLERLREVSDHFTQVVSDPPRGQMLVLAQALNFHARLFFRIEILERGADRAHDQIRFEVIWGQFKGMKGVVDFDPIDLLKCEVSVYANYATKNPPVPKAVMGFALEVIVQRVAESMRSYIEHQKTRAPASYHLQGETRPDLTLEAMMIKNGVPIELLRPTPAVTKTNDDP